ncbi:MAG: FtsQ-type POTRA domain-containing protein [Deltaproteobacteria bacterium]|nr:FtsQ-type POTRA domain-containing protein [Deltaproteobacteria bacterium]
MSASIQDRRLPSNRRVVTPPRANTPVRAEAPGSPSKPWDPDALWRNLRLAARVALGVLVVALGVFAAVHARRYVTQSPRFALKDLRISGNRHRSAEQVAQLAGISLGQNVVELDLEGARARLETDPWVERATLLRRLPASVAIEVVERDAAAIVALPSGTWLATPRGELFKKIEADDPLDLPVITGITDGDAASDRDATAQIIRRALDLGADVEHAGLFGGRVQELAVDVDGGITAVIGRKSASSSVRVVFGKAGYRQKVRLGARIEAEIARRGARPTVVFLDDDLHADRVVVRLVSALPPATVTVDGEKP